jgi:hypothetical protein
MKHHGFSERRACGLLGVDRSAFQYECRPDTDDALRARLRHHAGERRRFGDLRLAMLLKREGVCVNLKKVYRLYRAEKLTVRRRGGRKRALGTRAPMAIPQEANQRWSLDFVSDALADGRRFGVLNVVDDQLRFTRPRGAGGRRAGPERRDEPLSARRMHRRRRDTTRRCGTNRAWPRKAVPPNSAFPRCSDPRAAKQ